MMLKAFLFFCFLVYLTSGQRLSQDPFFIEEPENVTIITGKKVILKCVIGNANGRSAQWTFDNFGLGLDRGLTDWPHLRMVGASPKTDWNLEIDPVGIRDDGQYQCQLTPLRSRYAYVNVWVPPEDPFIEDGPVIHVKESVEVKLECVARGGKPPAKINWYDQHGNLINDATYRSVKMRDSKLFEARSTMTFTPKREHHNATFRCEAWNEAADNLRPALARLFVQYAPSVTVTPVRPGMIQEGDKAAFHCNAVANPPVYDASYKWFIDNREIRGQNGFYYEIFNVTRAYHDKQVRCSVENTLGVAMGLKSIEVKYGPTFLYHPRTTSGDRLETITLYCIVDSNPQPQYYWTKGSSLEAVSHAQNMSVKIDESSGVGTYYCHAETPGYSKITSRPAEVLMTGRPKIRSPQRQTGVEGENVHINCDAISIPEAKSITWTYHDSVLDDTNSHYRIINSPIQHGVRSTLIIKPAIGSDFGPYTCAIENSHGVSEIRIQLEQRRPFPLQITLIAIFAGVICVLVLTILVILCRKRAACCQDDQDKVSGTSTDSSALANNVILKVNNMDQMSTGGNSSLGCKLAGTPSQMSNEVDWPDHGSSSDDFRNNTTTQLYHQHGDLEPDFPPKPDVISTGYFPYAQYVRDYNPPPMTMGQESPVYSTIPKHPQQNSRQSSMLNVTDPRFSATYGNPLLRQQTNTGPRGMQYTTFLPGPVPPPQVPMPNTSYAPNGGLVSLPLSSRNQVLSNGSAMQTSVASGSTSTPNSSISNMACLPESEDRLSNPATNMTPSPPPPTPPTTSTTAIYARVNPNLKRDKTNNNNFTSTFSSTSTASQFQPLQPSLMKSSPSSSLVTPPSGSTTNTLDYQKLGLNNPSITNGCVDQQQQRLGPTGSVQQGLVPSGNGSLQRPNGGHNLQLHAINSTVGTHV